jgi:hypothetical protein
MRSRSLGWLVYSMISVGTIYYCFFSLARLMEFLASFSLAF